MPIMFCSAMPTWKKRSGYALANGATSVYLDRSAESTTSSGRSWPSHDVRANGASTRGAVATGLSAVSRGGPVAGQFAVIRPLL